METKEKLLKLINSCLEKKSMYNNEDKDHHCIHHNESERSDRNNRVELKTELDKDALYSVDYSTRSKYEDELQKNLTRECISYPDNINIKFDAEPPITIYMSKKDIGEIKICDKIFLSRESYTVHEEIKTFWGKKKTIEHYRKKEILITANEIKMEFIGAIVMGELRCEITLDEFKALSTKFKEKKKEFTNVKYTDILDDRISRYC